MVPRTDEKDVSPTPEKTSKTFDDYESQENSGESLIIGVRILLRRREFSVHMRLRIKSFITLHVMMTMNPYP